MVWPLQLFWPGLKSLINRWKTGLLIALIDCICLNLSPTRITSKFKFGISRGFNSRFCRWISATDSCEACDQVETYENILDNFCRADFGRLSQSRVVDLVGLYLSNNVKLFSAIFQWCVPSCGGCVATRSVAKRPRCWRCRPNCATNGVATSGPTWCWNWAIRAARTTSTPWQPAACRWPTPTTASSSWVRSATVSSCPLWSCPGPRNPRWTSFSIDNFFSLGLA